MEQGSARHDWFKFGLARHESRARSCSKFQSVVLQGLTCRCGPCSCRPDTETSRSPAGSPHRPHVRRHPTPDHLIRFRVYFYSYSPVSKSLLDSSVGRRHPFDLLRQPPRAHDAHRLRAAQHPSLSRTPSGQRPSLSGHAHDAHRVGVQSRTPRRPTATSPVAQSCTTQSRTRQSPRCAVACTQRHGDREADARLSGLPKPHTPGPKVCEESPRARDTDC